MTKEPILSLLFPLYRSLRFFENLVTELSKLKNPDFEIIISDRHCLDNTLDLLEQIFGNDKRFKFFRANDHVDWVTHYNILMRQSKGKYFCWVPHDDIYDENYFEILVQKLETDHSVVLAFATMHVKNAQGM